MDITAKTILEVNEDNILIQLEGLEHLLYEEDEGLLSFEINQQFVDKVAENVQKQLQRDDFHIEIFWDTWSNVLYSAVSDTLKGR